MAQADMTWAAALADAGCYGFLAPVASRAVDHALGLCPEAAPFVGEAARKELRGICLGRLGVVYERPLIQLAVRRVGLVGSLALGAGGEAGPELMRDVAERVRDEVSADGGAALRERLPLAPGYERVVADNFSRAVAELLDRLLPRRDEVSRELLGGRPITRVLGFSADGADAHRHGRMVMRVETDAGQLYYKPHDCGPDALFPELVGTWFPDVARTARLVAGDGYAFVERLVPEELSCEGDLRAYWRNFGRLAALFHGLGSRDMTQDNVMCCGLRPAVLDLETLLTGEMDFDKGVPTTGIAAGDIPADAIAASVACTSVLPVRMGGRAISPLVTDNASGTCLPRLRGERRTVRGYERDFSGGFEEGYRRLMRHRGEVLATLSAHADATCRQILLNTWSYERARALLFSPGAMSDPARRDEVLGELNARYAVFPAELGRAAAPPDAAALAEGDIPYYFSRAASRTLHAGDGGALGELLARSALEVATSRLERLSQDDLAFELDLINRCLAADAPSGGKP